MAIVAGRPTVSVAARPKTQNRKTPFVLSLSKDRGIHHCRRELFDLVFDHSVPDKILNRHAGIFCRL